ncbi:ornithine carbamoyltransferase [Actinoplanes auranticolor]|uniref:Ornithine carbamoyltransferase n=1 Tax=Actinoplanes auranticolor TaxID=47988 RepID=A0A919W562_9ACTN|nr:ornithine carbamoyltransferase [Actinoplanes auranticolor]GIM80188.1 ornithine carbamoyltransferase [Actinoplanes auranticolor]
MVVRNHSVVSIDDLDDEALRWIVERGAAHSAGRVDRSRPLDGQVIGLLFQLTSTRTRTAFSAGALRLGAGLVTYGPNDLQLNTGESTRDTGVVFGSMLDGLVARVDLHNQHLYEWAGGLSVVNAMSVDEHPTQALTDLTTMIGHFGRTEDLRVLYVGEGNNTAVGLALALMRCPGSHLELRTPPGYGVGPDILARARARAAAGATVTERHDMADVADGFDVIYTTRWRTTGTSKPDADWMTIFRPFQVDKHLWDGNPNAVLMHDLPAHRGEEVTAELLDGPLSIAFTQAANKMYSAMAVLEWCRRDT